MTIMKNNYEQIYRVSFKNPPLEDDARSDFYFTSLAAIYDQFDKQEIGCQVERLWNLKISPDKPYVGRKCTITKEPLGRKKHKQKQ
jgi:hypothetical protein